MTLEIISSHSILFKGEVTSVTLPGELGSFTVLKDHAPIISVLKEGNIVYKLDGGEERETPIKGGLVDVLNNTIAICIY